MSERIFLGEAPHYWQVLLDTTERWVFCSTPGGRGQFFGYGGRIFNRRTMREAVLAAMAWGRQRVAEYDRQQLEAAAAVQEARTAVSDDADAISAAAEVERLLA